MVGFFVHALTAGPMTRLLLTYSAVISIYLVVALESLTDAHPRAALAFLTTGRECAAALNTEAFWCVAESLSAPVSRDSLVVKADAILCEISDQVVE